MNQEKPGAAIQDDEMALFQQELNDVKPIQQDTLVQTHLYQGPDEAQLARRQAAIASNEAIDDPLSLEYAPQLSPYDMISFKRGGIQDGVFKKLRLGKYEIQARLDLHQKRLEQAKLAILDFIRDCMKLDIRCAIIIHGKGEKSNPPAFLKSYVSHWLPQLPEVQAVHSAQPGHGGTGAVYVLLRKSPQAKHENREKHTRRQGGSTRQDK